MQTLQSVLRHMTDMTQASTEVYRIMRERRNDIKVRMQEALFEMTKLQEMEAQVSNLKVSWFITSD
jgi:hypothetical protein